MRQPVKSGDTVRLRKALALAEGDQRTATVELPYIDIEGGVLLRTHLGGFVSWNRRDLAIVRRAPVKRSR